VRDTQTTKACPRSNRNCSALPDAWAVISPVGPLQAVRVGPGETVRTRQLRTAAAARRADLRHALSVLLDLTVIALSGGAGVEQALTEAATPRFGPGGWAARRLHSAIVAGRCCIE
jgi:Flp pilus assembly protein TadB